MYKYELKKGKILKDGHIMFLEDVVRDLNRKSHLEEKKIIIEEEIINLREENEYFKKIDPHNIL